MLEDSLKCMLVHFELALISVDNNLMLIEALLTTVGNVVDNFCGKDSTKLKGFKSLFSTC